MQDYEPAPGTAHLDDERLIEAAECSWDKNPRNPERKAQIARNISGFEALQRKMRRFSAHPLTN